MSDNEKCPECEEMQKIHKDYCVWCSNYKDENNLEKEGGCREMNCNSPFKKNGERFGMGD